MVQRADADEAKSEYSANPATRLAIQFAVDRVILDILRSPPS